MYLKIPVRNTRGNVKLIFDIMSRTTTKYLNSPFLLGGTALCDNLPVEIKKKKAESIYMRLKRC